MIFQKNIIFQLKSSACMMWIDVDDQSDGYSEAKLEFASCL